MKSLAVVIHVAVAVAVAEAVAVVIHVAVAVAAPHISLTESITIQSYQALTLTPPRTWQQVSV